MRALIDEKAIADIRARAMSPDRPVLRGTAQNPDAFFQGREAANPFYAACPEIVQKVMDEFASVVGREYHLFDYVGAPDRRTRDRADGFRLRSGARSCGIPERQGRRRRHAQSAPLSSV